MGLDMYLKVRVNKYHSKWWKGSTETDYAYPKELEFFSKQIETNGDSASVDINTDYKIGQWRKFNALHGYIVENFADGVDECQEIPLTLENIETMLELLKKVEDNPSEAAENLPTASGFFFGSQDYDDWYFQDVSYSIELFEKLVELLKEHKDYQVVYIASW